MRSSLLIAETPDELGKLGASVFLAAAKDTLQRKGFFDVLLSGGSTPKKTHQYLATNARDEIDWLRVRFFWGDERVVPPDHPESNYRMARETLLEPLGISTERIFRFEPELGSAPEVASLYEERLKKLFREPAFDFAFMGIGEDGHTASLFPDARSDWEAAEKERRWATAPWVPHLGQHRLTLLPWVLNSARKIAFLVSGQGKAAILQELIEHDPSEPAHYPAELIRPNAAPPEHRPLWLADRAAASQIAQAA